MNPTLIKRLACCAVPILISYLIAANMDPRDTEEVLHFWQVSAMIITGALGTVGVFLTAIEELI